MSDLTPESEALVRMRGTFLYSSSPRYIEAWLRKQLEGIEAAVAARATRGCADVEMERDMLAAAHDERRATGLCRCGHDETDHGYTVGCIHCECAAYERERAK